MKLVRSLATSVLEVECPSAVARFTDFHGEDCRSVKLHGTQSFCIRFDFGLWPHYERVSAMIRADFHKIRSRSSD